MRTKLIAVALAVAALNMHATLYTTNWSSGFLNSGQVPDNNLSGWSDSRNVAASGAVQSLSVTLQLSGGWNGDLFAYLLHDSGYTVLVNHVGTSVSGVSSYGYGDAGMNVTFTGLAGASIHQYGGNSTFSGAPTGSWQPDYAGGFSSFNGVNASGNWYLFIADTSGGSVSTVQSWGLQMDIVPVPEVETWVAAALAGAFGTFWLKRQKWARKGS